MPCGAGAIFGLLVLIDFFTTTPEEDEIFFLLNIKNKIIKKESISFDLFLGDESKGLVVGIIPVVFKKAHLYNNNDHVYVFGKLTEENDNYYIEGKYIIDSKQYELFQKRN